jgi:hypothetical protein
LQLFADESPQVVKSLYPTLHSTPRPKSCLGQQFPLPVECQPPPADTAAAADKAAAGDTAAGEDTAAAGDTYHTAKKQH